MSAAWLQSEMSDSACLQAQAQIPCAAARTSGRMGLPARSASLSHQSATSELLILHHDLRVGVAGRIEGVSPGAIAEILGGAGYESRAGHSKRPPIEVHDGWCSSAGRRVFVYLPPLVSRRKAYILNHGTVASGTFLFRGRYSGQGLRNSRCYRHQTLLSSRVVRLLDVEQERVAKLLDAGSERTF
jgi:hypothetical protein